MKTGPVECLAPSGDVCGEAATWSETDNRLYWVDINRFLLHSMDMDDRCVKSVLFDEPVVAISLTDMEGTLLVALASRLILWTPHRGESEDLGAHLPGLPDVRFNDGRCDPRGDFWVGSMGNNVGPNGEELEVQGGLGKLFRYRNDAGLEVFESDIGISNTLCWSPDRSTFYFADSLKNEVRAYDYDSSTGQISNSRVFFAGFDRGAPDGSAIDQEGYLWNCRFGGQCVVRVSPQGIVDTVVEMPVKNITTCTFGGADLSTLFVTTASAMKNKSDRLAGSVFSIRTQTAGMAENRVRLSG